MNKIDTITSEILESCLNIHAQRGLHYGDIAENFTDIADIATRLFSEGIIITPVDIAIVMIATKEARYKYAAAHPLMPDRKKVMRDSLIDWINYIAIMENLRILSEENTLNKDVISESTNT